MAGGRLGHTTVLQIKQKGGPCLLNQAGTEDHDPKWGWARRGFPRICEFTSTKLGNHENGQRKPARGPGPGLRTKPGQTRLTTMRAPPPV